METATRPPYDDPAVRAGCPGRLTICGIVVRIIFLRHARAGHKRFWSGPDELRPLDTAGVLHARQLPTLLREQRITRLVSSPTARCVQTLEPLAAELDQPVETTPKLAPDASSEELVAMLDDPAFDGSVICTHGEVLRPLLDVLIARGAGALGVDADDRRLFTKGTGWDVTLSVTSFRHIDPTG